MTNSALLDNSSGIGLRFHHVGLIVENMEEARHQYGQLFGSQNISDEVFVGSQNVNICFVKVGDDSFIELIKPNDENSVVFKLMKKKVTYYHTAYSVDDIKGTVEKLEAIDYKALSFFNSEAFENKLCVFLFSPSAHLIELIEQ